MVSVRDSLFVLMEGKWEHLHKYPHFAVSLSGSGYDSWLFGSCLCCVFFCQPPTSPSSPRKAPKPLLEELNLETVSALHAPLVNAWHFCGGKKRLFGSIDLRERPGGWEKRKIDELYRDEEQVHMYAGASPQQKASVGKRAQWLPISWKSLAAGCVSSSHWD